MLGKQQEMGSRVIEMKDPASTNITIGNSATAFTKSYSTNG